MHVAKGWDGYQRGNRVIPLIQDITPEAHMDSPEIGDTPGLLFILGKALIATYTQQEHCYKDTEHYQKLYQGKCGMPSVAFCTLPGTGKGAAIRAPDGG